MVEVTAKTGLVGFFDILGYQQMLLANDVASTARVVVDVLAEVPNLVVSGMFEDHGLELVGISNDDVSGDDIEAWSELEPYYESVVREETGWLLFSDSILVSLPIELDDGIPLWGTKVVAFVEVCSFLLRRMFDVGLPLRGGISFGEFFIHDTFFSGRPIIDAYQHSESLQLSGCILAPSAAQLYGQMKQYAIDQDFDGSIRGMLDQLCVDYLIPKKRNGIHDQLGEPADALLRGPPGGPAPVCLLVVRGAQQGRGACGSTEDRKHRGLRTQDRRKRRAATVADDASDVDRHVLAGEVRGETSLIDRAERHPRRVEASSTP